MVSYLDIKKLTFKDLVNKFMCADNLCKVSIFQLIELACDIKSHYYL